MRIQEFINQIEELWALVPTEDEQEALECLHAGNLAAALMLFKEASTAYDNALRDSTESGKKAQSDAWVNWRLRGCFPLDSRPLCWAASRAIRDL